MSVEKSTLVEHSPICVVPKHIWMKNWRMCISFLWNILEVSDGQVVGAGVPVTWNVLEVTDGWVVGQASQWQEMYCHDLEVMSLNPSRVELGVLGTSTLSHTWISISFLVCSGTQCSQLQVNWKQNVRRLQHVCKEIFGPHTAVMSVV